MAVAAKKTEADAALEAWARWARSGLLETDWPSANLIAKVIEYGVMGASHQSGKRGVEVDSLCELVDRAVRRLSDREREVIVTHYFGWQPMEVSARRCKMTYGTFRQTLHKGRRRVGDYLDGAKVLASITEGG